MDIETAFAEVGEFGRYQKRIVFGVGTSSAFLLSVSMVVNVFLAASPTALCVDQDKSLPLCTNIQNKTGCTPCDECRNVEFTTEFSSVVSEWHLVCEESFKANLVQSALMFGCLIGAVIFGRVSDKIGRLRCVNITMAGTIVTGFACAFALSYNMLVALKFVGGIFIGGYGIVSFVYVCEIVGASYRVLVSSVVGSMFAVGIMALAAMGYFVRDWRYLSAWTTLPFSLCGLFYWFLPESPRWLYSTGKTEEAEAVFEHIGNKNNRDTKRVQLKRRSCSEDAGAAQSYSVSVLVTHSLLRWRTILQGYSWFINCVVYYGLTLGVGSLGSNRYIALALSGFVELPANFIAYILLDRLGRKPCICSAMIIGGSSCIVIAFLDQRSTSIKTALALCGKMLIAASFTGIYVHSAELHPTVVRNLGMGFMSMVARIGGILAPMVISLDAVYPSLQFIVFGALGISGGLINLKLPETLNKPMPETIQDLAAHRQEAVSIEKVVLLEAEEELVA